MRYAPSAHTLRGRCLRRPPLHFSRRLGLLPSCRSRCRRSPAPRLKQGPARPAWAVPSLAHAPLHTTTALVLSASSFFSSSSLSLSPSLSCAVSSRLAPPSVLSVLRACPLQEVAQGAAAPLPSTACVCWHTAATQTPPFALHHGASSHPPCLPNPHPLSATVGLDAAGKTTILYKLKLGEIVTTIPTIGTAGALCRRAPSCRVITFRVPLLSLVPSISSARASRSPLAFSPSKALTSRRSSTRTSTLPCGTSEVRTRSARCGATTSRTRRCAGDLDAERAERAERAAARVCSAWSASSPNTCPRQGLIFVVDSNDRERASEARDELNKMVRVVCVAVAVAAPVPVAVTASCMPAFVPVPVPVTAFVHTCACACACLRLCLDLRRVPRLVPTDLSSPSGLLPLPTPLARGGRAARRCRPDLCQQAGPSRRAALNGCRKCGERLQEMQRTAAGNAPRSQFRAAFHFILSA